MLARTPEPRLAPHASATEPGPHLEVGPRLAIGGMAEIFEATLDGAPAVLKRALPGADAQRTDSEASALAAIRSPHVVCLLGRCPEGLVLERVHGPTLGTALASASRHGRVIAREGLAALVDQLLLGLDAIHRASDASGRPLGLLHRDLSPSNVLLGPLGRVVLCDLGLARATAIAATTVAGLKGTLGYMAPEQLRAEDASTETDLFAAALMLYEAATGVAVRPSATAGVAELLAMRSRLPAPPSAYRPDLGPDFDAALLMALAPQRDARYASAVVFRQALLDALPPPNVGLLAQWAAVAGPAAEPIQATFDGPAVAPAPVAAPVGLTPRSEASLEPPVAPARLGIASGWAIAALGVGLAGAAFWTLAEPSDAAIASASSAPTAQAVQSRAPHAAAVPVEPVRPEEGQRALRRAPADAPTVLADEAPDVAVVPPRVATPAEPEGRAPGRRVAHPNRRHGRGVVASPGQAAPRWSATLTSLGAPLHVTGGGVKGLAPVTIAAIDGPQVLTLVGGAGALVALRLVPTDRGLRARIGAPMGQYWEVSCGGRPAAPSPVTLLVTRSTSCSLTRDDLRVAFTLTAVSE